MLIISNRPARKSRVQILDSTFIIHSIWANSLIRNCDAELKHLTESICERRLLRLVLTLRIRRSHKDALKQVSVDLLLNWLQLERIRHVEMPISTQHTLCNTAELDTSDVGICILWLMD